MSHTIWHHYRLFITTDIFVLFILYSPALFSQYKSHHKNQVPFMPSWINPQSFSGALHINIFNHLITQTRGAFDEVRKVIAPLHGWMVREFTLDITFPLMKTMTKSLWVKRADTCTEGEILTFSISITYLESASQLVWSKLLPVNRGLEN